MQIIISGLGRMGSQIAQKLCQNGHQVVAHNRSPGPIDEAVRHGAIGAYSKQQAITKQTSDQVVVWLMIPNDITDAEIDAWLEIIPKGSIIIDGGNSDFRLTLKRAKKVSERGSVLIDCGTSGGVWGYKNGFSMMVGGDEGAFKATEPIFKTLAEPGGSYFYFGPSGSGHFVKMVHNAIEYGMMESLAEGYRMLKEGPYDTIDLGAAGLVWQKGSVISSWLNELCRSAVADNPDLNDIDGVVAESGEARWTLELARDLNIDLPAIQAAFDVRLRSQNNQTNYATKLLAAMRNKFGGHEINPKKS